MLNDTKTTRNPRVIIGAMAEVLSWGHDCDGGGCRHCRIGELLNELEESLNVQQFEMSLRMLSRPESAVRNVSASVPGESGAMKADATRPRERS